MKVVRFIAKAYSPLPQWGELDDNSNTVYATSGPGLARTGPNWRRSSVEMLVPVAPTKIVCVGRNYAAHAAELGNDVPTEPGLFLKGPNTLTTTGDTVPYPYFTENFNFEGELAAVIGKRMHRVRADNALSHVLGYTCALDLTARDKQKTDLQWFRAKSADKFCPVGPWVVTGIDPTDVHLQTRVNDEVRQDGRTSDMIFPVAKVLEYVSHFMTLEPGDVVLTGTPEGVGALQPGDKIEVEIEGIGVLETHVGERG